jgi:hypothetical protein
MINLGVAHAGVGVHETHLRAELLRGGAVHFGLSEHPVFLGIPP